MAGTFFGYPFEDQSRPFRLVCKQMHAQKKRLGRILGNVIGPACFEEKRRIQGKRGDLVEGVSHRLGGREENLGVGPIRLTSAKPDVGVRGVISKSTAPTWMYFLGRV
jgi:hypothetical protein